jgi:AbrB family looped-hinge helix DNA binding protein
MRFDAPSRGLRWPPTNRVPRSREFAGIVFPVETTVDSRGRVVVPKALRDELALAPGATLEVTRQGTVLQLRPVIPTARLVEVDGLLVAESRSAVTDDVVLGLRDDTRR